jgi:hypothetical protein
MMVNHRSNSLRVGRSMSTVGGVGARRGSVAPGSPERWRKASITATAVAAFSFGGRSGGMSRQGSTVNRSGIHFAGVQDTSTDGSQFGDIARSESTVFHGVDDVHVTPLTTTISPPPQEGKRSLFSAGGLMAKSMKALDSVNGNFDVISKRLEAIYKPLLALEKKVAIQEERYYVSLAETESVLDVHAGSSDAADRVESFTCALLEVLQQYRERDQESQHTIKCLEQDKHKLIKECAELRMKIPVPVETSAVACITTIDSSNWEYLVKGDVALLQASQLALHGGGSVRPTPTFGLESPRSALGDSRAHSAHVQHHTPTALDAGCAEAPRRSSSDTLMSPSKANESVRMDEGPAAPDQPSWASTADPEETADVFHHQELKRQCLIQWLLRFHRRKQRSMDAFLEKRIAPVLGLDLRSSSRKPTSIVTQRPNSARRAHDDPPPTSAVTLSVTSLLRATDSAAPAHPRPPQSTVSTARPSKRCVGTASTQRPFSASHTLPPRSHAIDKPDLDWIREGRLEMRTAPVARADAS